MDPTAKQSVIDRLNQASNILITVKNNPSVDQLAALIGASLFFNKLGKHTTAVFSGTTPSTLEFLKLEDTIEKSTDSLRDFIISLDTNKADKIRWKVDKENEIVKIFITPYRTSIAHDDLDFSHGDLNVDVLIGLGVESQADIDQAITAHGRILHDATVITLNTSGQGNIGTLHLEDKTASSLCEMMVDLADTMKPDSYDEQMATAFLTGIVAETNRFSNEKTSPRTMTLAGVLMNAGANQQLIATKLKPSEVAGGESIQSAHEEVGEVPEAAKKANEITISHEEKAKPPSTFVTEKPKYGGTLTASSKKEELEASVDALGEKAKGETLQHGKPRLPTEKTLTELEEVVESPHKTLEQIERGVDSEHTTLQPLTPPKIDIPASEAATAAAGVPGGPQAGPIATKPLGQPAGDRESVDDALKAVQTAAAESPPPQTTPPPPPKEPGELPIDANVPLPEPTPPKPTVPAPPISAPPAPNAPAPAPAPQPLTPQPPTSPLPPVPEPPRAPIEPTSGPAPLGPSTLRNPPPPAGTPPPVPPPMMPPTPSPTP